MKPATDKNFDVRVFYADMISFDPDEINDSTAMTNSKVLNIHRRIREK